MKFSLRVLFGILIVISADASSIGKVCFSCIDKNNNSIKGELEYQGPLGWYNASGSAQVNVGNIHETIQVTGFFHTRFMSAFINASGKTSTSKEVSISANLLDALGSVTTATSKFIEGNQSFPFTCGEVKAAGENSECHAFE